MDEYCQVTQAYSNKPSWQVQLTQIFHSPAASLFAGLLSLLIGSTDSNFCDSFESGGGFSGTVGCTPSTLNQCARRDTSKGILGGGADKTSFKSISFSSIKCNSLPPPDANLNGSESGWRNPYWGWRKKKLNFIHNYITVPTDSSAASEIYA